MDCGGIELEGEVRVDPVLRRLDALLLERQALQRRLQIGAPGGKQERRRFRLQDIEKRLIPQLMQKHF